MHSCVECKAPGVLCKTLLKAGMCLCNCTRGAVQATLTPVHCSFVYASLLRVAMQNRLTAGMCFCRAPVEICILHTYASDPDTSALQFC